MYTFLTGCGANAQPVTPVPLPKHPLGLKDRVSLGQRRKNLEKVEEMFFIHSHAFTPPTTDSHERTQWSKSCAG